MTVLLRQSATAEFALGPRGQAGRAHPRRLVSLLRRQGFIPTVHFIEQFRARIAGKGVRYDLRRFGRDFDTARHGIQTRAGYATRVAWVQGIPVVYRLGGHANNRVVLVTALPPEAAPPTRPAPSPRRDRESMSAPEAELEAALSES